MNRATKKKSKEKSKEKRTIVKNSMTKFHSKIFCCKTQKTCSKHLQRQVFNCSSKALSIAANALWTSFRLLIDCKPPIFAIYWLCLRHHKDKCKVDAPILNYLQETAECKKKREFELISQWLSPFYTIIQVDAFFRIFNKIYYIVCS